MFKTLFKKPQKNDFGKTTFSQCGEDILVDYIFKLRKTLNPNYLDIGANHPWSLNNTAVFYRRGCMGVNVEANPELVAKFNSERSRDININVGIGTSETILDFYVMKDETLSTFSEEECKKMQEFGKELKEILKVPMTTINSIMEKYFPQRNLDFLSIDIEGLDFEILQQLDFDQYAPKIICAESAEYSPIGAGERRQEYIDFILSKGYVEYANTNLNSIFVRKDFWFI